VPACKARGGIKARGTQRTEATPVFAAIRTLHRFAGVLAAMHHALNQLSEGHPAWVRSQAPLEWYDCSGRCAERGRLPTETRKREALAPQSGADGSQRLDGVRRDAPAWSRRARPAREGLRQIWRHHAYRCTVPGLETQCYYDSQTGCA
jgi:hypothetical protein